MGNKTYIKIFILLMHLFIADMINAQSTYFVDGYHGGIYGHYPIWFTGFINKNLKSNPEWRIGLEIEPETWDSVQVKTPNDYYEFKKLLESDKIEFTNPTYSQPYCYNILGESLIRQFGYGIKKLQSHFPSIAFNTYSAKEPCFTSCLPMILNQFGFKYISLKCPDTCWGGYTKGIGNGYINLVGSDGTKMKALPRYECEELEDNSTWQTIAWKDSDKYWESCRNANIANPVGMCFQDAGWKNGPWIGKDSKTQNILWTDYIEKKAKISDDPEYHFTQEDVLVNLMWGSQVLNVIGAQVRKAENRLLTAEKIGSISFIDNGFKIDRDLIDEGWRTLMLSQHHDSWIVPYNKLNNKGTWADNINIWTDNSVSISNNEIKRALERFEDGEVHKAGNNEKNIIVFNTLSFKRMEMISVDKPKDYKDNYIKIEDSKGNEIDDWFIDRYNRICFYANVPSFGYSIYRLIKSDNKRGAKKGILSNNKKDGKYVIENDFYKIVFDSKKGGVISSLVMKKVNNRDLVDKNSKYGLGEIRGFFYEDNCYHSSTDSAAEISVINHGNDKTTVEIRGKISNNNFLQTVILDNKSPIIKYDLTIDWKKNQGIGEYKETNWREDRRAYCDDRYKLSILFPTNFKNERIYKDAPFDVCESKLKDTFFNSWSTIKNNIILNWVDAYSKDDNMGLSLFSNQTTSYLFGENFPLGLTIQYSGTGLWGRDYKIDEKTNMQFAILPHKVDWEDGKIQNYSNAYREPLVASIIDICNEAKDKSLINVSDDKIIISAAYEHEGKLLVRFFNSGISKDNEMEIQDESVVFNFPVEKIEETDLNLNTIKDHIVENSLFENRLALTIPPFGIKTFLITIGRE
ncbi:MAG: glycoside hydrolase family 38 C-terminal domain-containing protein [Bacteroidales bacterium]|nr:glycoside hydrolase family 38 C-terminal domain-containing protein [Bacteroidales bacterium]